MFDEKMLDMLVCPECKGVLDYDKEKQKLICNNCQLKYGIEDGIPIMLVDKAEKF